MSRERRRAVQPLPRSGHANQKAEVGALAQAGRLEEAKALATRLCSKARKDPEAWFLLGAIHGHLGEYEPAADCCRKSIALQADVPMTHYNLGIALHHLGDYRKAAECFRRASKLQPAWPEAHHDLGNALQAMGEFGSAIESYQTALQLRPGFAQAEANLGNALQASHDLTGAVAAYRRAVALDPYLLEAHLQLAHVQLLQGALEDSAESYQQSIAICPDHVEAQLRLADVHRRLGKLGEAATSCRRALTLEPGAWEGHFHLGLTLQEQGDLVGAEASLRQALQIAPDSAVTWNNLGLVLQQAERRDEAEDAYRRALALDAAQPEAHRNLAKLLRETGRCAEAGALLDVAIELDPEAAEPHWDRALLWLLQGDFERGWPEYEWRWEGEGVPRRDFGLPPWDGADPADLGILVYAEQGVGDEIMFASCLPDLMERAKHVVLDCDPRLVPLFRRSFPAATVHGGPQNADSDWLKDAPPVSVQTAVGSLPLYLRRRLQHFPNHSGYLVAAQQAVRKWRKRYEALGTGLKIGISWRGGRGSQKTQRSTRLDHWRDLLSLAGTHWINVQYGDCDEELCHAKTQLGVEIHHWKDADPLKDLDDYAAQIAALDLVISIDNSAVHLAGALGVEVWTLQPYVPNWRWLPAGSECHWYPSLRHFRQPRRGDWEATFEQVRRALNRRL